MVGNHHRGLPIQSRFSRRRRNKTILTKSLLLHNIFTYADSSIPALIILNLCGQLGNDGLQLYGPTSIFRLAPSTPERPTFNEEVGSGYVDAYRSLHQENLLFNSEIDWSRHLPQVPLTVLEHDRCVLWAAASSFLIDFLNGLIT